jgi:hypothetical protein
MPGGLARRKLTLVILVTLLGGSASPGWADTPSPVDPAAARANASLQSFATTWMEKLRSHANASKELTRRVYETDVTTEVKPTGNPKAPFVGLIRYTEKTVRCSSAGASDCITESVMPVTEIFRLENDRWVY